jgi:hypothetical protein
MPWLNRGWIVTSYPIHVADTRFLVRAFLVGYCVSKRSRVTRRIATQTRGANEPAPNEPAPNERIVRYEVTKCPAVLPSEY